MIISKEFVTRVVDSCYSSPYKIFTINSHDGYTLTKPLGLFVSLGITTSMNTMNQVADEISSQLRVSTCLAEISSRLINNRYVNCIDKLDSDVVQFNSGSMNEGLKLSADELRDFIADTKAKIVKNVEDDLAVIELTNRLTKMIKVLNKLESKPFDNYATLIDNPSKFDVFVTTNCINYIQTTEHFSAGNSIIVHKRIGILVNFS